MQETVTQVITQCYHCGDDCEHLSISIEEKYFCCEGCKLVYEILNEKNLCDYYSLNEKPGIKQSGIFAKNKFEFLEDEKLQSQLIDFKDSQISKITFFIPSMHCSSCIWLLENLFKINSSIVRSQVNYLQKNLTVTFLNNSITLRKVVETLASIGYEPKLKLDDADKKFQASQNKTLYSKIGIAGFAFGNIMLLTFPEYLAIDDSSIELKKFFSFIIFFLSLPVFFYCSSDFLKSAYYGLKSRVINLDVPLSLGIVALFFRSVYDIFYHYNPGYMDSFAGLIFLLLIGRLFLNKSYEVLNFERNYKSYFPISVTTKKNNIEKNIPLANLNIGDKIVVRNNELIPADSFLLAGDANIDYSFVTGEAIPVHKKLGEIVYAGGRQVGSIIELEITKEVSQSYLSQLWNNSIFKDNVDRQLVSLVNHISKYFTIIILFIAFAASIYWLFVNPAKAVPVFTAVLIIACPCALAMSTPFTLSNAMRILGRNSLFVKNTLTIESLAKIDTIVFDKTGTITEIDKSFIEFIGEELKEDEKKIASSLVKNSTHPLSKKIFNYLNLNSNFNVEDYSEIAGLGISGNIFDSHVKIGSIDFVNSSNGSSIVNKVKNDDSSKEINLNEIKVYLSINGIQKGYFKLNNYYRKGINDLINDLSKKYQLYLLSGDNKSEYENLKKIFGDKSELMFNQTPFDKLEFIKKIKLQNKKVLMIGDGLNDSGALKQSDVGISISEEISNFSPASDAILEAKSLYNLNKLLDFSKISVKLIITSFIISFLYNVVGLYVAVQGELSPLFAAIIMPISSVTVIAFASLSTTVFAKIKGLLN